MENTKPSYEELEQEVIRLRKLQEDNIFSNDELNSHHECMHRVNNAIQNAADIDEMMSNVLQAVLGLFDVERAWLLFPCDPNTISWTVPMERTKPGYEGVHVLGEEIPILPKDAEAFARLQNTNEVVTHDYSQNPKETSERFYVLSEMHMPLHPKTGKSWLFGIHQCTYARVWTNEEKIAFKEIGNRLSDALNSFLYLNELKASEYKFKSISEVSPLVIMMSSGIEKRTEYVNPAFIQLFGYTLKEVPSIADWWRLAYPNEAYRKKTASEWEEKVEHAINTESEIEPIETIITCKDGSKRNITWSYVSSLGQNWAFGLDITEQKQAEDSLRRSKYSLENLTNSLTDIVISVKMPERVIEWSNHSIRSIAYEPDEIIGQTTAFLFTNEENYLDFGNRLQQSVKEGNEVFIAEQLFKRKNGDTFSADVRVTCDIKDGEIVRATSIIRDITERKQSEKAVKESEEKFKLSFQSSPVAQAILTLDGKFVESNIAFTQLVGYSRDEIIGKTADDLKLLSLEERKKLALELDELSGSINNAQIKFCIKDGSLRDILYSVEAVMFNGVKHRLSMGIDITEQKQAEYRIQESEEKYRALFDNAPLSYQSLDKDGKFIDINPSWLRTLGYQRHEVIGKFYADFLHPDWKAHFEKNFPAFKKRGYVNDVQFKIRHKKGHYIDISFEGCIGYLPDGSFKQTYCVFQDITIRKKAEDEILQSQKRLYEAERIGKIGNWSNEPATGAIKWSEGMYRIFGLNAKQQPITYELMMDYIHEEDRDKYNNYFEHMQNLLPGQVLENLEYRIVLPEGEIHWIDVKFEAQFDGDKNPKYFFGTARNITERKQAEKELYKSEQRYRELVNSISSGVAIFKVMNDGESGSDYIIKEFNEFALNHEKLEKKDVIGKSLQDIRPNMDEYGLVNTLQKVWKTGESACFSSKVTADEKFSNYYENRVIRLPSDEIVAIYDDVTEGKQAAEEVSKLNALLNQTGDLAKIGGWELDLQTNLFYFTDEMYQIYEITPGEKLSLEVGLKLYPLETQIVFKKAIADTSERNVPFTTDVLITTEQGKKKWVRVQWKTKQENGKVIKLIGTLQDITARKQAEEEFKNITERLQFATEGANIGTWHWNTITGELIWSSVMKELFDIPQEEVMTYERFRETLHPDDRTNTDEAVKIALDNHTDFNMEYRCIWRDGTVHWRSALGRGYYDESGKNIRMEGVVIDINDQKQAEQALIRSQEKLNLAIQGGEIGVWEWDLVTNLTIWDAKMERMFGLTEGEFDQSYDAFKKCVHPDDIMDLENAIKNAIDGVTPYDTVFRVVWKNKEVKYIRAKALILKDNKDQPISMIGICIDVSKIKMVEEQLNKHKENLEELVDERTKELEEKYAELERINKLFVGRELRMVELKEKIKELESKLN